MNWVFSDYVFFFFFVIDNFLWEFVRINNFKRIRENGWILLNYVFFYFFWIWENWLMFDITSYSSNSYKLYKFNMVLDYYPIPTTILSLIFEEVILFLICPFFMLLFWSLWLVGHRIYIYIDRNM
jgi:hypothetical protein